MIQELQIRVLLLCSTNNLLKKMLLSSSKLNNIYFVKCVCLDGNAAVFSKCEWNIEPTCGDLWLRGHRTHHDPITFTKLETSQKQYIKPNDKMSSSLPVSISPSGDRDALLFTLLHNSPTCVLRSDALGRSPWSWMEDRKHCFNKLQFAAGENHNLVCITHTHTHKTTVNTPSCKQYIL